MLVDELRILIAGCGFGVKKLNGKPKWCSQTRRAIVSDAPLSFYALMTDDLV